MIVYGDTAADLIGKLSPLLRMRPEPCAAGVTVSNMKPADHDVAVVVSQGPESDRDTINTAFMRVNVYHSDEGHARDLVSLVRAIVTTPGMLGAPFVYGELNAGPNPIDDKTGVFHWYMVFELRTRGVTI